MRKEEVKWFPGIILEVKSPVTYIVHVAGQTRFVHADHLRKRHAEEVSVTQNKTEVCKPKFRQIITFPETIESTVEDGRNSEEVKTSENEEVQENQEKLSASSNLVSEPCNSQTANAPYQNRPIRIRKAPNRLNL